MKYKLKYGKEVFECEGPEGPAEIITRRSLEITAEKDFMRKSGVPSRNYDYENAMYIVEHPAVGPEIPEIEILER